MASLEVPFKAENYLRLAEVISKGIKSPIPDRYSEDLQKFIDILMHKDPRHRPSADKLLYHPRISECLTNINLKKRINLKIEKEEFIKRQKEVFLKEQKLRHKERELERLNSKYLKRVKELKELEKNLERRHSKMKNLATNPDFSRNMKGNDLRKLNKTVDQAQDMSVINGSQERHIDTSLKVERMSYDLKEVDYNIENINTSNRNLLSSTSSYSANNYKNLSSHESKNLSSSNNFDDSQKDINSSLTKRPGQIRCELYGKNVKINLCNDDNSNGSTENYKAIGSNCLNNDSRDKIHSLMTRDTATIVAKKVKNALENHMATKERSFETNTLNTTRGLPPSGQKQIQRTSLEVAKQTESNSGSNPEGGINLSRNYSTNFLQNANNDEGSRNRLGNRKSIPVSFRTNSVENLHAAQNIQ